VRCSKALVATLPVRGSGVTAKGWRLQFPMAPGWFSDVGGLPPVDVPMSSPWNWGTSLPSHLVVVGKVEAIVWAPIIIRWRWLQVCIMPSGGDKEGDDCLRLGTG
jgi:hypothetical protein